MNKIERKREARQDYKFEVRWRKLLLKRLEYPQSLLTKAVDKEKLQREMRLEKLSEYQTVDEIQEAYGYDQITDEERIALVEALEQGQLEVEYANTPSSVALGELNKLILALVKGVDYFEFELLPPAKKKERLEAQAKFEAEQAERRERQGRRST